MLSACPAGPEAPEPETASGDEPQTTGTTLEPETAGPGPTTTTTTDEPTGTAATTEPAAPCPDGDLDEGEACDDGNDLNGDGCNNDCQPSGQLLVELRPPTRGSDVVNALAVDADGSIVAGGLDPGFTRWVGRFSDTLEPQWSQSYGAEFGLVTGVATFAGGIYAAGGFATDDDAHDVWLARLDPSGAVVWEDTLGSGLGEDYLTDVAIVGEDELIVSGFVVGEDGLHELWARRYAADGIALWTSGFSLGIQSKIWPLGPGLVVTPEHAVLGWSRPLDGTSPGLLVAFPVGGGGDPSWTLEYAGENAVIQALAREPGGDLALAGRVGEAMTVRRVTSTGAGVWSSDACTGTYGRDIAVDSQGDVVAIGDGPGATGLNIRLCKFSPEGELRWGKDIDGGFGTDIGYAVAIGAGDRIVAGGSMASETQVSDLWLAVFSP
ncbi:hypothetical protein [Nannocystis bainbridge]|uniref:Myxococcus cysteine-rich repeat-containing protein n=1 Tax=Nannocystis bainbridge TaxID=2995303 RepID=A0ABT5DR97_9BACT|nr:hypothetical protein [Nannocystis bainbridge]MDC0716061.1 hypothetical protein [Nannocystis bainbridge]